MTNADRIRAMKPILFRTEMVRGILSGRKSMTWRVVKPQPEKSAHSPYECCGGRVCFRVGERGCTDPYKPPYRPGDILYVREAFSIGADGYVYKADEPDSDGWGWRPSIHMPREAARLFLRVTEVYPQQMKDVTEADAEAEGFDSRSEFLSEILKMYPDITEESWVWAIEFEKIGRGGGRPMKPIYKPKGAAAEYGDFAVNIYTGCPHRCCYCFAPQVLRRDREAFHSRVEPRPGIVDALRKQLEREKITGQLVHLCFTCDPYPTGYDTTATREVIRALKEYGNHVQILTKGDGSRDFDLLDGGDWYGVTISGAEHDSQEPGAVPEGKRLGIMQNAPCRKWISFEPVIQQDFALTLLSLIGTGVRVKIGKLNYHPSDIDWARFGRKAEEICRARGLDYYIKESLRAEMERV